MSDQLRRIYNNIDSLFDFRALHQEVHLVYPMSEPMAPQTAGRILQAILPYVRKSDGQAAMKMIVCPSGLRKDGTSCQWEFFFDLPVRRAQMSCRWILSENQAGSGYEKSQLQMDIKPFPAVDSQIRRMVREGKLLHRQMIGMWKQEFTRRPVLAVHFRDTDLAMEDFIKQGLDPAQDEFSLTTGLSPQKQPAWLAQCRRKTFYTGFLS